MQAKKRLRTCPFVLAYTNDVLNGEIYEKVNQEWENELNTKYSRNEAKKQLNLLFNSPNHIVNKSPQWTIFKKMYPSVADYFYGLNEGFFKLKKESTKDDFKSAFAYIAQGIEKYLLLDVIVSEVKKIDSCIPTITLHDGIFTTQKYVDEVREVMLKVYSTNVGVEPKINVKCNNG